MTPDPTAAVLAAALLGRHLDSADEPDAQALLDQACAVLADHVGAVAVALYLFDPQSGLRAYGAHPRAARIVPQEQFGMGEGPCVDAWRTGVPVVEDDLPGRGSARWPRIAPLLVELGGSALCCQPVLLGGRCTAAVTVVLPAGRTFGSDALRAVRDAAALIHLYAGALLDRRDGQERVAHLQRALDSRVAVEQAKGFLAAERGSMPDDVFEDLRQHARASRRPIAEVAADVVRGDLHLPDREGAGRVGEGRPG